MARCGFDLLLREGAHVWHEWRDAAQPYRVGPSFQIKDRELLCRGRVLRQLPIDAWVHFEVLCPLGDKATGAFALTVQVSGEPAHGFDALPCGSGGQFTELRWLGFVALGEKQAVFYLDNVRLRAE